MKMFFAITALVVGGSLQAWALDPLQDLPDGVAKVHRGFIESGVCQTQVQDSTVKYPLGNVGSLFLVDCLDAAYQSSYRGYITVNGSSEVMQVIIDSYSSLINARVATVDLTTPFFDQKNNELSTFDKGRAPGDCGEQTRSKVIFESKGGSKYIFVKPVEVRYLKCGLTVDFGAIGAEWPVVIKPDIN